MREDVSTLQRLVGPQLRSVIDMIATDGASNFNMSLTDTTRMPRYLQNLIFKFSLASVSSFLLLPCYNILESLFQLAFPGLFSQSVATRLGYNLANKKGFAKSEPAKHVYFDLVMVDYSSCFC